MSLKMYAEYKILKKDEKTNKYRYLTAHDFDEVPFPGAFGFTIDGDDIPFDFYETTTQLCDGGVFGTVLGRGEFVEGDLTEEYDDVYADMGLTREDLTPEFLSSASHIYEFYLNFEDCEGDEYDSETFEENTSDETLFKMELLAVSFIDEREIEYSVRKEVLDEFNGKIKAND